MSKGRNVFRCYDVKIKVVVAEEHRKQFGGATKAWQTIRQSNDLRERCKGEKYVPRFNRAGRR